MNFPDLPSHNNIPKPTSPRIFTAASPRKYVLRTARDIAGPARVTQSRRRDVSSAQNRDSVYVCIKLSARRSRDGPRPFTSPRCGNSLWQRTRAIGCVYVHARAPAFLPNRESARRGLFREERAQVRKGRWLIVLIVFRRRWCSAFVFNRDLLIACRVGWMVL